MLKELFLQWLSWRQAPKNIKKRYSALSRCYNSLIIDRLTSNLCPLMYPYDICSIWKFSRVSEPYQTRYSPGGAENRRFCVFLTLEFEFLMTYEVSRPLHRRKPFIVIFTVFPSVSRDYINLNGKFELQLSVFSNVNIELLVTKTRSYIVYSSPNDFSRYIIV